MHASQIECIERLSCQITCCKVIELETHFRGGFSWLSCTGKHQQLLGLFNFSFIFIHFRSFSFVLLVFCLCWKQIADSYNCISIYCDPMRWNVAPFSAHWCWSDMVLISVLWTLLSRYYFDLEWNALRLTFNSTLPMVLYHLHFFMLLWFFLTGSIYQSVNQLQWCVKLSLDSLSSCIQ